MSRRLAALTWPVVVAAALSAQPAHPEARRAVLIVEAIRSAAFPLQAPVAVLERGFDLTPAPDPGLPDDARCPEDFFTASEIANARETLLAFPIRDPFPVIVPEPGVVHRDRDRDGAATKLDCVPYAPGHLCYDQHEGTDFMLSLAFATMEADIPVRAAADGRVRSVEDGHPDLCVMTLAGVRCLRPDDPWNFDRELDNHVTLCHPDGKITGYRHLVKDSLQVERGQRVQCGDVLGHVGSSGNSSAPHLHLDVRLPRNGNGEHLWTDPYAVQQSDSHWVDQRDGANGTLPSEQCQ